MGDNEERFLCMRSSGIWWTPKLRPVWFMTKIGITFISHQLTCRYNFRTILTFEISLPRTLIPPAPRGNSIRLDPAWVERAPFPEARKFDTRSINSPPVPLELSSLIRGKNERHFRRCTIAYSFYSVSCSTHRPQTTESPRRMWIRFQEAPGVVALTASRAKVNAHLLVRYD